MIYVRLIEGTEDHVEAIHEALMEDYPGEEVITATQCGLFEVRADYPLDVHLVMATVEAACEEVDA